MEFDAIDRKLLAELYHSYRASYAQLGRKTNISAQQARYRIQKYISTGLIRRQLGVFNYSLLGYKYHCILFLKTQNVSSIISQLQTSKSCISYGKVFGVYDLWCTLIFKNNSEYLEFIDNITENNTIQRHLSLQPTQVIQFPLKFLGDTGPDQKLHSNNKTIPIDDIDKRLLKSLSQNSSTPLIDLAKEANISSELTLYRLRRLKKEGVIIGSRIQFDMELLGYHFSEICLRLKKTGDRKKIESYAHSAPHIHNILFCTDHILIQLFHATQTQLREAVSELKKLVEIVEMNFMLINQENGLVETLPFYEST